MSSDLKRKPKKKNPKPVQINPNWSLLQQVSLLLSPPYPSFLPPSSSTLCSAIGFSLFGSRSLSLQKLKSDSNNSGNRKSSNNDDSENPRSILGKRKERPDSEVDVPKISPLAPVNDDSRLALWTLSVAKCV
ncbi:hypothetical protein F2Q68_00017695 [Brassica cretica]|uniref:Uncharacterized protein n=1 Tax=Brassica cretica TaxID=69181 RepID=A0A8S9HF02_BRACR|nr:hypothetical protein F2Q68_00017695 [Brassica cretica]